MAQRLEIDLLGGFTVTVGERAVSESAWRLRKARSVLKLLALEPAHALHREQVIDLLWPDREPAAAANNLRQALHVTRRALDEIGLDGNEALQTTAGRIVLQPAGGVRVDVEEFERAAAAALADPTTSALQRAIDAYGGELLPEDRYEPWAVARREALSAQHLVLLLELARLLEEGGDAAAAIAALQSAVGEDPLNEPAHCALMRLYAATGQRQRALAQYHALRETLRHEVADEPDEETRLLYRSILTRQHEPAPAAQRRPEPAVRRSAAGNGARRNLPLALTSFIGREAQLSELDALLGRARLVTLIGPGGAGKTRLALEAAAARSGRHSDGVWLAELGPVTDAREVALAAAAALGADTSSPRPVHESLAAHVGDADLLLVLDNCEHVVDACAELAETLLSGCAGLTVLATSREALRVGGEVAWPVPPLSLPEGDEVTVDEALRSGAVQLLCERAAAAAPGFELTADNVDAVVDLCRKVEGVPLALELAAARVGVLSVAQIAERLQDSLAVLSAGRRTAPTRQQTLTGALDWSHDLLDDAERALFRRLAVFAAGCSLESVEEVCGDGLAGDDVLGVLARLVDKSLVVVDDGGDESRFRLLTPIRQYALERLEESGERAELLERHRARYLAIALEAQAGVMARDPRPALARLERDHDDLQAALHGAVRDDPQTALRLAHAQWRSWFTRGQLAEADAWLQAALDAAPEPTPMRAQVLLARSIVAGRLGRRPLALGTAEESHAIGERLGDERIAVDALLHAGVLAWVYSDLDLAQERFERARAIAERLGDRALDASVLVSRAGLQWSRGRLDEVDALLDAALARLRELAPEEPCFLPVALGLTLEHRDDGPARMHNEDTLAPWRRVPAAQAIGHVLASSATAARWRGDLDAAAALLEDALARFRGRGDAQGTSVALVHLGATLRDSGELDVARELIEESLALRRERRDAGAIGIARNALALLHTRAGEHATARELLERSAADFAAAGDAVGITATLADIGYATIDAGDLPRARASLEQALTMATDVFHWLTGAAWLALALAGEARAAGDDERERTMIERAGELFARNDDAFGQAACLRLLERVA